MQIPVIARQLVLQQDAPKFEALSLLHYLLASQFSVCSNLSDGIQSSMLRVFLYV